MKKPRAGSPECGAIVAGLSVHTKAASEKISRKPAN